MTMNQVDKIIASAQHYLDNQQYNEANFLIEQALMIYPNHSQLQQMQNKITLNHPKYKKIDDFSDFFATSNSSSASKIDQIKTNYNKVSDNVGKMTTQLSQSLQDLISKNNEKIDQTRQEILQQQISNINAELNEQQELQHIEELQQIKSEQSGEIVKPTFEEAFASIEKLVGLEKIKNTILQIKNTIAYDKYRNETLNLSIQSHYYHFLLVGNDGVGKTTVANYLADILLSLDVVASNKVIKVSRADLVGQYVGETAPLVHKYIKEANEGVLLVDDLEQLYNADNNNDFGREALATLEKHVNDQSKFSFIATANKSKVEVVLNHYKSLASNMTFIIDFDDYTNAELIELVSFFAQQAHYKLTEEAKMALEMKLEAIQLSDYFSAANTMKVMVNDAIRNKASIDYVTLTKEQLSELTANDFGFNIQQMKNKDIDSLLAQLDALVGLDKVKQEIRKIVKRVQLNISKKELNLPQDNINLHMVFTGNPGTGKTTVSRIVAQILKEAGVLKRGQLVEVTREDLIGEYVGQTAVKTMNKIKEAYGGVLYIDEAYALYSGSKNDFGQEAIATLIKEMENNRDKLVVILSGYTYEMQQMLEVNSGMLSRIGFNIEFEDYTATQLYEIFNKMCQQFQYQYDDKFEHAVKQYFEKQVENKDRHFGNGRLVRNFLEKIQLNQGERLIDSNQLDKESLLTLIVSDLPENE